MKKWICIFLTLVILGSLMPGAFAVSGPGSEDLKAIESKIEYPKVKEYLDEYEIAKVKAPKGYSVLGYGSADRAGSSYEVMDGDWVLVLAKRGGMSCCIVLSQNKGRWINSDYLQAPGEKSGRPAGPNSADLKDISSKIEFPEEYEYYFGYTYGVIQAPDDKDVYGYGSPDGKGTRNTVPDGAWVVVLARSSKMLCVIIPSLGKARWVEENCVELKTAVKLPSDADTEGSSVSIRNISLVERNEDGSLTVDVDVMYSLHGMNSATLDVTYSADGGFIYSSLGEDCQTRIDAGEGSHVFRVSIPTPESSGASFSAHIQPSPLPPLPADWSPIAFGTPVYLYDYIEKE